MKLQVAMMFQEHMVLQQNHVIPVWGRSVSNDEVTVCLNTQKVSTKTKNGEWYLELEPMSSILSTKMTIYSKKTNETIYINDVAIGEVILAGGQSNMEFLMKYDYNFEEVKNNAKDNLLRYFCYPQTAYVGFNEKEPNPDWGYWRTFEDNEDKKMFNAVGAYVGLRLREQLNVPIGIISCNWGGTPAPAWASMNELENNSKLRKVLDWNNDAIKNTKWEGYIKTAFEQKPEPSEQEKEFLDKFMMGVDLSNFMSISPPPMDPNVYNSYLPGPLSCIRPAGLYENMVSRIAPYPISSFIWWQGEDDDARDWVDFYDESMKCVINSWRKLWKEEIPFFQVELAPFESNGITKAKKYNELRKKQHEVSQKLKKVYDICILDAGEKFNIHPRHKKIVGYRLANMILKYVYHKKINADCPTICHVLKEKNRIELSFDNSYGSIQVTDKLKKYLIITSNDIEIDYDYKIIKDKLILVGNFTNDIVIKYCDSNYCEAAIFNAENSPLFGFTLKEELGEFK